MSFNDKIAQLQKLRNDATTKRRSITDKVEREERADLTSGEASAFQALTRDIRDIDDQIAGLRADSARAGGDNPETAAIIRATTQGGESWARRAAATLHKMGGETRAISSGSVDVPSLVDPAVTPKARPARLVDLLVNRVALQSNSFEYFRQSVRTNNAAPVADLGTKPTSTFTVAPVIDRARVIAHLSEEVPIRLWQDATEVVNWLDSEMREGVLDALEAQVISGAGTGENLTGILNIAGTTAVPFATDVVTTLRKGITSLQTIGVAPNAWVVSPPDAEAIDLTKEASGGVGFLLDGYQNGTAGSGNVFGPNSIQRVVSPSVPAGVAVLADWSQVRLYVREGMRLDIDAGGTLFTKNAAVMRAEIRVGLGHLRPASFAICDLTA